MATFISRREAQEKARQEKEQRRKNKLRHKDLLWSAKRRYLDDQEWYELFVLDRTFGKWGEEQAAYEFGKLEELREFFERHSVGSKCPHLNALEKHLALHAEKQETEAKQKAKKIVKAHPSEALTAK
jgi:hypothetical protein